MAKKEKNVKEKKQNSHYFKDMKAELKKVIWPSSKQTVNNTMAVIVFTLVAAVIVFVLDLCFDSLNKYAITPLQEKVQSSYQASHNTTVENTETNNKVSEENVVDEDAENVEVDNKTSEAENTDKK